MSDWLSFGGGIIDTGLGLIRDHLNRKHQKEINEQNWQQEQEAATTAYERQLAIMDKYNTPMAQRAMLEEAGLNVGMMYSKGGAGGGGGGASVAKAQGATAQAAKMEANLAISRQAAEIANINADTKEKQSQANLNAKGEEEKETYIEKLKADTILAQEQAQTEVEKREGMKLDNAWKEIDVDMKKFEASKQAERYELEKKLINGEISLKEAMTEVLKAEKEQHEALTKKYEAETRGINIENKYIAQMREKQMEEIDSKIALNQANAALQVYELAWREESDPIKKDQMKVQLDQMKVDLEMMEFANDKKEFTYHYNNVLQGIGAACDIANTVSNFMPTKFVTTSSSTSYNKKGQPVTSYSTSTTKSSKF